MRAVTRRLDVTIDLNDVAGGDGYLFVRNGVGVAARGVAARVPYDDVPRVLESIEHDDGGSGAAGPVAVGVLPFLPGSSVDLVIPSAVVRKSADGCAWMTLIDDAVQPSAAPRPSPCASSFEIRPAVDVDHYLRAVEAARDAVRTGDLVKAVIARPIVVTSDQPIDVHAVLRRLRASFGSSYRYSVDGFIGASPELLVEVDGETIRSHPLAGTAPITGDLTIDAGLAADLIASTKNQVEHRAVIEMVHDTLLPWCSYLDWEPEPSIVKVANVQHLGSLVEGRLSNPAPNVLELVRALSPTPAVGGHPRSPALD
ncbi:MAG: chorismate-binding protein, partial [Ilumatobacteraceae bacterium]